MAFNWSDLYTLQDFLDEFHEITIMDTRASRDKNEEGGDDRKSEGSDDLDSTEDSDGGDQEESGGYANVWQLSLSSHSTFTQLSLSALTQLTLLSSHSALTVGQLCDLTECD
jgi:hypothetical protein